MPDTFGPRPGESFHDYCERLKAECRAKIAAARPVTDRPAAAQRYWWQRD